MFGPMALRQSMEKVNVYFTNDKSRLKTCQDSIPTSSEEVSPRGLSSTASRMSETVSDKSTRRHLDALIASCRYSFGAEWFNTDSIWESLSSLPPWGRTASMSRSSGNSDDSGVFSPKELHRRESVYSSTNSIDRCVQEYLQQQSLEAGSRHTDKETGENQNTSPRPPCPGRQTSKTSNESTARDTLYADSSRHSSMEAGFRSRVGTGSPSLLRSKQLNQAVAAEKARIGSCASFPRDESTESLETTAEQLFFDKNPSVRLSLQYFRNGDMLRVIIVGTNNLGLKTGEVFFKVALFKDNCEEEKQTVKSMPASQAVMNKEVLFEDKDLENSSDWVLRVRVYSKRSWFAKAKCVGETNLALDQFDLFMNTTCCCLLRPKSSDNTALICRGDDVRLMSRDRSISAYAAVNISATNKLRGSDVHGVAGSVRVRTPPVITPQAAKKCQLPRLRRSNTEPRRPGRFHRIFNDLK